MKKILLSAAAFVIAGSLFSAGRFTDNADGTIKDNVTGLTWTKCYLKTVSSIPVMDATGDCTDNLFTGGTWENALLACENLDYAGIDDWRLPNINELGSIVCNNRYNPTINQIYFPRTQTLNYWSSTTFVGNTLQAWAVNFSAYNVSAVNKTTTSIMVRCVTGP